MPLTITNKVASLTAQTNLGRSQSMLTTSLELMKPQAQILIYAKNMSPEDFQHALDGVSLAE